MARDSRLELSSKCMDLTIESPEVQVVRFGKGVQHYVSSCTRGKEVDSHQFTKPATKSIALDNRMTVLPDNYANTTIRKSRSRDVYAEMSRFKLFRSAPDAL